MKYTTSIIVNKPRDMVAKYFADPTYLKEYQDTFIKKELVSGDAGQEGAVSNMYYTFGKNEMELVETITVNRLPESFEAHYHHKHMDNTMKCTFTALDENRTKYEAEFEYTRISWVMPKLIAILFPGMYRKQGQKWLNNFKAFVESQDS